MGNSRPTKLVITIKDRYPVLPGVYQRGVPTNPHLKHTFWKLETDSDPLESEYALSRFPASSQQVNLRTKLITPMQ